MQAELSTPVAWSARYFPTEQELQEEEAVPEYFPDSQRLHCDSLVAPMVVPYLPRGHSSQAADESPRVGLKDPESQR